MTEVRIVAALVLILSLIWMAYWLLYLGLDGSRMNRRVKDAEHPSPDELRNRAVMVGQLALMGWINVTAATLAGIGGSLFDDGGRFRWPSSPAPYELILLAAALMALSGMIIATYITRPAWKWILDTSDFRSYLRQLKRKGVISETEPAEIRKRREKWQVRTNVRPLRSSEELRKLGLELEKAHEEWGSPPPNGSVEFGARLREDVSDKQVRRWIWCKRRWQLWMPPFIAGCCAIALMITGSHGIDATASLRVLLTRLLLVVLVLICIALVRWLTFRVGRLDLVMTNRYFALERKQLNDCKSLIEQIEVAHGQQQKHASHAGADGSVDKLVLRIGRWDLSRRDEEIWHTATGGRLNGSH